MSYTVDIQSTSRFPAPLLRATAAAAHAAMNHQNVTDGAALTILLTDDDYIRQLNFQYRGEDHATDVLSFPAGEAMPGAEEAAEYLGDIAIAVPFAQRQAAARGHQVTAELQLLAVHGVLHLLGHDHLDEDDKAAMWQTQAEILRTLGLEGIQPTEEKYDDP